MKSATHHWSGRVGVSHAREVVVGLVGGDDVVGDHEDGVRDAVGG